MLGREICPTLPPLCPKASLVLNAMQCSRSLQLKLSLSLSLSLSRSWYLIQNKAKMHQSKRLLSQLVKCVLSSINCMYLILSCKEVSDCFTQFYYRYVIVFKKRSGLWLTKTKFEEGSGWEFTKFLRQICKIFGKFKVLLQSSYS